MTFALAVHDNLKINDRQLPLPIGQGIRGGSQSMRNSAAELCRERGMKIGVTSQNFKTITGHAGKTRRFLVFSGDAAGRAVAIDRLDLPKALSMHEFRGTEHPLDACDVLITAGCGDGFIQRMVRRGIRVVTTSETDPATAVTAVLAGLPLPEAEPHRH